MPELAPAALKSILATGEYDAYDNIVIFDEHKEFDKAGNLVRDFTPAKLQQIADFNNRRLDSGNPGFTGLGHTIPPQFNKDGIKVMAKEEDQPKPIGIRGYLKVDKIDGKSWLIATKYYLKKRVTLDDGKTMTSKEVLDSFPRRSIELWDDGLLDWVALLRVTPERDLGVTLGAQPSPAQFQRALQICPWQVLQDKLFLDSVHKRPARATYSLDGKLRYAMEESPVPDPTMAPSAADDPNATPNPAEAPHDLNPEESKLADRFAKYYKSGKCIHYAMESPTNAAAPGAAPQAIPEPAVKPKEDNDDIAKHFARDGNPISPRERILIERLSVLENSTKYAKLDSALTKLEGEGYQFDMDAEKARCQPLPQERIDEHLELIRKNYARAPVGGRMLDINMGSAAIGGGDPKEMTEAQLDVACHYMRKHKCSWDKAVEETKTTRRAG